MADINTAIRRFPVVLWLAKYTRVWDSGADTVWITCPVCHGRKKLGVHRHRMMAHCFKCNEGGAGGRVWKGHSGLIRLIELVARCSRTEAVKFIFDFSGLPDKAYQPKQIPADSRKLPAEAVPLTRCSSSNPAVSMLVNRHCEHLVPTSFVCASGVYSHRVLMPIRGFQKKIVGFDAKSYVSAKPKSLFPEWQDKGAMYVTSAWNWDMDFAVITESVLDAETLGSNAVGILGSVLRPAQLIHLRRLRKKVSRLVWFLDADAWRKQYRAIFRQTSCFDNYLVPLEKGEDPNDLGRSRCWEKVSQAIPVRDDSDLIRVNFLQYS